MRVLIVDPDGQSARVLEERLEQAGMDVGHAASPAQLEALLRVRAADVVLCDLSRRRMNGFDIARQIHSDTSGRTEVVLLTSGPPSSDPEIAKLQSAVQARFVYEKPVDPDVLIQGIRTPRPTIAPEPKPESRKPDSAVAKPVISDKRIKPAVTQTVSMDWDNAKALLVHWAGRSTGVIDLDTAGQVALKDGGLVDSTASQQVTQIMLGVKFNFREEAVENVGDWIGLGNQIFLMARSASEVCSIRGYRDAVPVGEMYWEMARTLAVCQPTRAFLGLVDGQRTVDELVERSGVTFGEVSADLEALIQLGMLSLNRGQINADTDALSDSVPEGLSVEVSTADNIALENATESADLEGLPTLSAAAIASANRIETPEVVVARLSRELDSITGEPPPVVLGVPAESEMHMVDQTAARMRNRYMGLSADVRMTEEVRMLADKMVREIDRAHKYFDFSVGQQTGSSDIDDGDAQSSDLDAWLEHGRDLIAAGEWAEADLVLTKAHQLQLDHVGVLANLGWARLHNPKRDQNKRSEEGRDYLLLAEQFDAHDSDGQFYLAQVLLALNKVAAAEQRAKRAMNTEPGEPRRAVLYRKIQVKLAAVSNKDG